MTFQCRECDCEVVFSAKTGTEPNSLHGRPAGRQLRLRRPDLIAKAAQSMHAFDLVSKERVYSLRPACHSCRILGPQTPVGGRRATRVDVLAA